MSHLLLRLPPGEPNRGHGRGRRKEWPARKKPHIPGIGLELARSERRAGRAQAGASYKGRSSRVTTTVSSLSFWSIAPAVAPDAAPIAPPTTAPTGPPTTAPTTAPATPPAAAPPASSSPCGAPDT